MAQLAPLIIGPARLFALALALLIGARLLNRNIHTRGLLTDSETGRVSALRVQMLIATFVAAGTYAGAISKTASGALPPVNTELLLLVAGTNGLLISDRALNQLRKYIKLKHQG